MAYFRYDNSIANTSGQAIQGVSIAVLTQPANTVNQPGSPLATLFAASTSNSNTITAATWFGGQLTVTFGTTPSSDVIAGSYISLLSVNPTAFNGIYQVFSVSGNTVVLVALTNPGTYVSGGTVATSALPNPTFSDSNGNYFFYTTAGIYTVQVYDVLNRIPTIVFPDQNVVAGAANGSVTSVAMTMDGTIFAASVSGSPITAAGTFTPSLNTVTANYILAGPTGGSAAAPTYRALVASDLPANLPYVTSVAVACTVPSYLTATVSGSPVTTNGTITVALSANSQTANTFLAGAVSGGASTPVYRTIAQPDLPTLNGTVTLTGTTSQAVTFSTSFNSTPTVVVTPTSDTTATGPYWVVATVSGFTVFLHTQTSPPVTVAFNYVVFPHTS